MGRKFMCMGKESNKFDKMSILKHKTRRVQGVIMEKLENKTFEEVKQALINDINLRNEQGIIEKTNADLIIKLINNAEDINEAITIAELGTTYKRTGFHFVKKLEKMSSNIKYLKKNEDLSFDNGGIHHKLIIGDNYDALQQLLISYKNTINIAYIDPPYASNSLGQFAEYDLFVPVHDILDLPHGHFLFLCQFLKADPVDEPPHQDLPVPLRVDEIFNDPADLIVAVLHPLLPSAEACPASSFRGPCIR